MADIESGGGGHHKDGKAAPKKHSTRVDMTPMVDLGFLLITFFMLTTTMIKPQTMEISMPTKDDVKDEDRPKVKNAVTVILGKNDKVYWYEGTKDEKTGADPVINTTDFSKDGIRKALLAKNYDIVKKVEEIKKKKNEEKEHSEKMDSVYKKQISEAKADRKSPVILIKATDGSTYRNLVDILDEMQICSLGKYAIVPVDSYDLTLIKDLDK